MFVIAIMLLPSYHVLLIGVCLIVMSWCRSPGFLAVVNISSAGKLVHRSFLHVVNIIETEILTLSVSLLTCFFGRKHIDNH